MPYKHKRTGEIRAEMPPAYRVKFPGKICKKCLKPLLRGEVHQWDKTRKGVDYHQDCEDTRNSPWGYFDASDGFRNNNSNGASEQESFPCIPCEKVFKTRYELDLHIANTHEYKQSTNSKEQDETMSTE